MEIVDDFGLLAPIAWNSEQWALPLTAADRQAAQFGYVRETQDSADVLNFGHERYPAEADGTYIGYSPKLNLNLRVDWLGAVFFLSTDYRRQHRYVVGVYGFPQVGEFRRRARHPLFRTYPGGNVRAQVADIVYFNNPLEISDERATRLNLLPAGKALAKRGFNYLTSENVVNLLREAARLNRRNPGLVALLRRLATDPSVEPSDPADLSGLGFRPEADTLAGLVELERQMQRLRPEAKQRVATFIERGHIASSVKRHVGYKCLLCEALGWPPLGFRKPNGVPYVETHHVDPVANRAPGALGLANLLTVCANHHRQLHYGNARLLRQTATQFVFELDSQPVTVRKIKL